MVRAARAGRRRPDLAAAQHARLSTPTGRSPARWPLLLAAAASLPGVALIAWSTDLQFRAHWPASWITAALWIGMAPVLEEIVFRGGVQEWLLRWLGSQHPVSLANLLAATLFAGSHLVFHPPAWALATVVPGLLFGWAYERRRRLPAPILLHALYNAAFLCLLSAPSGQT